MIFYPIFNFISMGTPNKKALCEEEVKTISKDLQKNIWYTTVSADYNDAVTSSYT